MSYSFSVRYTRVIYLNLNISFLFFKAIRIHYSAIHLYRHSLYQNFSICRHGFQFFIQYLYKRISLISTYYISQLSYIDMFLSKLRTQFEKNITKSAFLPMTRRSSWSSNTVNNTLYLSVSILADCTVYSCVCACVKIYTHTHIYWYIKHTHPWIHTHLFMKITHNLLVILEIEQVSINLLTMAVVKSMYIFIYIRLENPLLVKCCIDYFPKFTTIIIYLWSHY